MSDGFVMSAENIYAIACEAGAEALNLVANRVYEESQVEVPKGPQREDDAGPTLAETGKGPLNSPEHAATPVALEATVSYNKKYARLQHEGFAVINREGGPVVWEAEEYTTDGTKSHFLEDPLKANMGSLEVVAGERFQAKLRARGL